VIKIMADNMALCTSLTKINLSGTYALSCPTLPWAMTRLHSIDLSQTALLPPFLRELDNAMVQLQYSNLTELNLSECHLFAQGVSRLCNGLPYVPLKSLNLAGNSIWGPGMRSLATVLFRITNLTSLNLSENNIAGGSLELSFCLYSLSNLASLKLQSNDLHLQEINHLCNALTKMSQLQILDLSFNGFGDDGVRNVLRCLQGRKTLHSLSIRHTGSSDACKCAARETGAVNGFTVIV